MSTAGGPRLEGIGRSGDSDIVLCMDAHDAGSYPGEPTENLLTSSAMDFSVLSTYTASTFTQVADGESPTGYACEMYYTGTVNASSRCRFGASTNVPTSGTAFATIWVKRTAGDSASMRPSLYTGYTWYDMDPLDGGGIYITSEYRPFGKAVTLGTNSGGPNPGFSMTRAGSTTASDKTRWIMPQLTTKSYAAPFVREGKGGTGTYNARPASVDLMIHGDVGTGTSFEDSSPSKHTITTVGNTTHSTTKSKFSGGSIYFDGSGDYLTIPASGDWDVGTGDWTFDCWAYTTTSTSYAYVFDTRSGSYTSNFSLYRNGLNLVYYAQVSALITATTVLTLNTWHHIALVRSGSAVTMYVDGVSVGSATDANDYQGLAPFTIGTRYSIEGYWQGYQDEFRFTKGTAFWTSAFTPPTRRNSNGPVVDLSGHDNAGNFATKDMTDVSTYRDGQVIEPVASAIWDFDNTDDVITLGPSSGLGITDTVSVFAWIKLDSTSGWNGVFGTYSGGNFIHFQIYLGRMNVYLYGATAAYDGDDAASYLSAGEWSHVGFTFGSDTLTVYVHGEEMPTQKSGNGNPVSTTTAVSIGRVYSSGRMFNGQMGNVQVYKTTLTAQQVKQNFNSQRSRFQV